MDQIPSSSSSNLLADDMTSSNEHVTSRRAKNNGSPSAAEEMIPLHQFNPGFKATDDDLSEGEDEFYRNHPGLARDRHSSARLYRYPSHREGAVPSDLLSMLPSRTLQRNSEADDADMTDGIRSGSLQYRSIREAKIRRRKSLHNAAFRRASRELDVTDDVVHDLMTSPDQGTLDSRSSVLREMSASLTQKREIRNKISTLDRKNTKKPSWWKRTKYAWSMGWRRLKMKVAALTYSLGFWQGHLKTVEGHFGTGVVSYFIFLRQLFLLNLPLFFLSWSFIVIPQLLYRFLEKRPSGYTENEEFTGLELLTGGGWLEDTVMYYGFYINSTINIFGDAGNGSAVVDSSGPSYNMQYAYLLTCAGFYMLSLIILGNRTAKSYRKNYVDSSGSIQEHFIVKVLNGWNYTTMSKPAASLRHKFIYKEIREYLSTTKKMSRGKSKGEWCRLVFIRVLTNIVVLALIGGSGYIIWFLYNSQSLKTDLKFLRVMALPLCISAFNIIMPVAFSMLGSIERYGRPVVTLYHALVRTMLMKGVTLGVLISFWLVQLNCHQKDVEGMKQEDVMQEQQCIPCWETYVGEEIYRLVIVDFFTSLLTVFFMEFCRRLLWQHCCHCWGKPEFNIGMNTLDLIYSQALCWLGAFYSPLLSLIQMVKLFILFYIKKISLMRNCAPSQKPWRAARTNTVFLGFLFLAFLMTAISVAMSIIVIKPSTTCGPFRGMNSTYDIIISLVEDWRAANPTLSSLITFFTSEGAVSGLLITLICFVYYLRIISLGRRDLVQFLLHQLRLEGRDKTYLLRKFREIQTQNESPRRQQPARAGNGSLPVVTVEMERISPSPKPNRSPAIATSPPTPYTELTPSSESVLPFTDCSDGVTPNSVTPSSPSSTLAVTTPDSQHSNEITTREAANSKTDNKSSEINKPDSANQEPAPDYLSSDEYTGTIPTPDYDADSEHVELTTFDEDAGLDSEPEDPYVKAWR